MKISCGEIWGAKRARLEEWHPFFPWWPRRVGERDCRVFEWIERKGTFWYAFDYCGWDWEYRLPEKK